MNTETKLHITTESLRAEAQEMFVEIKKLQDRLNAESLIPRNSPCRCDSGKKWKRCCLGKHNAETIGLERSIKAYNAICAEVRGREG